MDNLLVFLVLFDYFRVPAGPMQDKALAYGLYGAVVCRGVFVGLGAVALAKFRVVLLAFAGLLIFTSAKILLLEEGEIALVDSEDMSSCFNLFYLPEGWAKYMAFEKPVPKSIFGGPADQLCYPCMRAVPMGVVFAVEIMQSMARRFVFKLCDVRRETELNKDFPIPDKQISVVCMDGFDVIRRIQELGDMLAAQQVHESPEHRRFVDRCAAIGLPLNVGKRLVGALHGPILGGELDGLQGRLLHARSKAHKLVGKSLALVSMGTWTQAAATIQANRDRTYGVLQTVAIGLTWPCARSSMTWACCQRHRETTRRRLSKTEGGKGRRRRKKGGSVWSGIR